MTQEEMRKYKREWARKARSDPIKREKILQNSRNHREKITGLPYGRKTMFKCRTCGTIKIATGSGSTNKAYCSKVCRQKILSEKNRIYNIAYRFGREHLLAHKSSLYYKRNSKLRCSYLQNWQKRNKQYYSLQRKLKYHYGITLPIQYVRDNYTNLLLRS